MELDARLERIEGQLARIADAIEKGSVELTPDDPPTAASEARGDCRHPHESRVSMAGAGNDDFYCRVCQRTFEQPIGEGVTS